MALCPIVLITWWHYWGQCLTVNSARATANSLKYWNYQSKALHNFFCYISRGSQSFLKFLCANAHLRKIFQNVRIFILLNTKLVRQALFSGFGHWVFFKSYMFYGILWHVSVQNFNSENMSAQKKSLSESLGGGGFFLVQLNL